MEQILNDVGNECLAVFVGKSKFRHIPDFFRNHFIDKIFEYNSPNFIRDAENKSILIFKSFIYNIIRSVLYFKSIQAINNSIKKLNPDLIISFYEPLTGLYRMFYRNHIPCISVAHQFGWKYTGYISNGTFTEKTAIKLLTSISAYGSDRLFCICPEDKSLIKHQKFIFIPPLIRKEVKNSFVSYQNHLTVYLLNSGYKTDIYKWHTEQPEQEIQCFSDNEFTESSDSIIKFYSIDDKLFINSISSCKALATTAGFESICEAMYLCKPVMMVPVKNHYEQQLNAEYFTKLGAGFRSDFFDMDKLLNFTRNFEPVKGFKEWIDNGPAIIEHHISELLNNQTEIS